MPNIDDYINKAKKLEALKTLEPGEAKLIVKKITLKMSKDRKRSMLVVLANAEELGYSPIMDYNVFPNDEDSADNEDMFLRGIADFVRATDDGLWPAIKEAQGMLTKQGQDAEITEPFSEFFGTEATAIVAEDTYQGTLKNVISRWVE